VQVEGLGEWAIGGEQCACAPSRALIEWGANSRVSEGQRTMYCIACGKELPTGASFCAHCGKQVPQGMTRGAESSREKRRRLRSDLARRRKTAGRPLSPERDEWAPEAVPDAQPGESEVEVSPDEPQANQGAWLTWGTFGWAFFGVMYLLNTVALVYTEHSGADVLIGAPITAGLETLVVLAVLRLGLWVLSQLRWP
jgi:hypothetical protein